MLGGPHIYQWSLDERKVARKFKSQSDEPITAISYCGNLQPSGVEASNTPFATVNSLARTLLRLQL